MAGPATASLDARELAAYELEVSISRSKNRVDIYLLAMNDIRTPPHGTPPSGEEVKSAKRKARILSATALVKAVTEGWPTAADYENAALM
jgi:hypothetical protein